MSSSNAPYYIGLAVGVVAIVGLYLLAIREKWNQHQRGLAIFFGLIVSLGAFTFEFIAEASLVNITRDAWGNYVVCSIHDFKRCKTVDRDGGALADEPEQPQPPPDNITEAPQVPQVPTGDAVPAPLSLTPRYGEYVTKAYVCKAPGIHRRIELEKDSLTSKVPCWAIYWKDIEETRKPRPGEGQIIWHTRNKAKSCDAKFDDFMALQRSIKGLVCTRVT